jgi:hypothetical protein
MVSKKSVKLFFINIWGPAMGAVAGFALLVGLLAYKLQSLVPIFSPAEKLYLASTKTIGQIISNPLNAPHKLLELVMHYTNQSNIFTARLVSVAFAILAVGLFFYVLSKWYRLNIAILGTILFATSSWFLHYARTATPDILLTLLLAVIAYGVWIQKTKRSALVILFGAALAVSLVYIPGLVWFVLLGGIWQSKAITSHIKNARLSFLPITLLGSVILILLLQAIIRDPNLVKPLLGLPNQLPSVYDYFRHLINIPYQIFFRGAANPTMWLGRLPLLDLFAAAMCVLGIYAYSKKLRLDRTKIVFGILILGSLLAALRGPVSPIILTPFVYFLVVAGIAYMLELWYGVYPRNPLARILGYSLIVIAVFFASYYNLRSYFIAWPNAPATKKAYNLRR